MRLRFGDCTLDPEARELRRSGEPVSLSPRALRLLLLLLESRPRARSQQSLKDILWPDSVVGVTSLAQLVSEVRRALGDDAAAPRLVRTVSRFGYSFAGEVVEEPDAAAPGDGFRFAGSFVSEDREFLIPAGEALVGRGESCGVRLSSPLVSRVHARVRADDGRVVIEDAGSKNGTWVNGERIEQAVELGDGDEVAFGLFRVVFRGAGEDDATRTGRPR
jgi:DNA-binding winged helix-turn-helix (wHTH) protein